ENRTAVDELGFTDDAITHITLRYGYMDEPNIPTALRAIDQAQLECPIDVDDASYFLSKIELIRGDEPGMARWRKQLFIATSAITADAAEFFGLPRDRTVIVGSHIDV